MKQNKPNRIKVKQTSSLQGPITVPGDKSISHRALMFASIADGETTIDGLLWGDDCISTLKAFAQMGIEIDVFTDENILREKLSNFRSNINIRAGASSPGRVVVHGNGLDGLKEPDDVIDAGNSGTTIRLMSGLLAGQNFFSVITGDRYLRVRPMMRVIEPLSKMGAKIYGREGGTTAPLAIVGSQLRQQAPYNSPIASAQVKSAILLAGLYADGVTTVIEPTISRDHTERMLSYFGAKVDREGTKVSIEGGQKLTGRNIVVPGDISSAAFLMVAALITEDSNLLIKNVGINNTRTGIIDILQEMGGNIVIERKEEVSGELIGDIRIKSSKLKGIKDFIKGDRIPKAIDELPVVAVAAAFAKGTTEIRDAKELRVKESDRIAAIANKLDGMGIIVKEYPDGMDITGGTPKGSVCTSNGDHRIAMAMAIAGLAAKVESIIVDTQCIDTSFPEFTRLLGKIGADVEEMGR